MTTEISVSSLYASALVDSSKNYRTETSKLDLADHAAVARHAQIGIDDKRLLDDAVREYQLLHMKLTAQMKTHLNHMQKAFLEKDAETDTLSFQRPALYLGNLDEDGKVVSKMSITTANDYLAYSFLMFRVVSGDDAYNFQPNFVVSFKEPKLGEKAIPYGKNDFLNAFKYSVNGEEIQAFVTQKNGKKSPNSEAFKILKADKTEVEGILQNTFSEYAHACNLLKETSDHNAKVACVSFSDPASPDHFLELHTCLEIFTLAKDSNLCGEVVYEDFDWSDF